MELKTVWDLIDCIFKSRLILTYSLFKKEKLIFSQVKKGWRIEYCAASENSTQCPEEFEELYMQRRRWVASTLANMMLLIKEWDIVAQFNHRVTVFFLLYHAVLLFATLTGPSSVILVVSGMFTIACSCFMLDL